MPTETAHATHGGIVGSAPGKDDALIDVRLRLHWRDEDDTAAFAQRLAQSPALSRAIITLHGDLGAGKTTLVRHLLRALGVQGRIKSPTYAVVEPHQAHLHGQPLQAWHLDCYRFSDPREWEDAGLRDLFASPGLKLVEWPQKAEGVLPPPDLDITIWPVHPVATEDHLDAPHGGDPRDVQLRALSVTGQALLHAAAGHSSDVTPR